MLDDIEKNGVNTDNSLREIANIHRNVQHLFISKLHLC